MTLGNLTDVVAITWEFGANGYTAMNLMGAWFKRRCTARGGDAAGRKPSGGRGKTGNSKYSGEVIQAILLNVLTFRP